MWITTISALTDAIIKQPEVDGKSVGRCLCLGIHVYTDGQTTQ